MYNVFVLGILSFMRRNRSKSKEKDCKIYIQFLGYFIILLLFLSFFFFVSEWNIFTRLNFHRYQTSTEIHKNTKGNKRFFAQVFSTTDMDHSCIRQFYVSLYNGGIYCLQDEFSVPLQ